MAATLEVRDLVKAFTPAGHPAVDGVSFVVPAGEIVVLLGPSGCGKTTTLRCVAGLEHPTGGMISIGNRIVSQPQTGVMVPARQRGIGMVFQSYAVWPHMTVAQNVRYPLKHRGVGRAEAARGIRRPAGGVAVGRADAARRARPQHGLSPAPDPARRAAVQPRRQAAGAAARRSAPDPQTDRHDGALRHP
jgi:iron(III) transport system ATP-binding protein